MSTLEKFLVNESEYLKTIVIPLIETKDFLIQNEPDIFHDIIKEQFRDRVRQIIIDEYCKSFTITPEEAIIFLEGLDLEEFFKC
jgi:hypothetical protein